MALYGRSACDTSPRRLWPAAYKKAYEWDPSAKLNPVFVTSPVRGWVLCVGQTLFAFADARPPLFGDLVARLSAELRCDVQFFCTHRIVEAYGWARALEGKLVRAYLYVGESGETVVNYGMPTPDELHLGFALFSPGAADQPNGGQISYPTEEDVLRLAGRWSLNPTKLPPMNDGLLGELRAPVAAARARDRAERTMRGKNRGGRCGDTASDLRVGRMTGKVAPIRIVLTIVDRDHFNVEWFTRQADGTEQRTVLMEPTRRPSPPR